MKNVVSNMDVSHKDLIIGGVWGHMNIDHWVPMDSVKAWKSIKKRLLVAGAWDESDLFPFIDYDQLEELAMVGDSESDDDFETVEDLYRSLGYDIADESSDPLHTFSDRYMGAPNGKVTYLENLRDTMYAKLKGKRKGGEFAERYSIAHISSSVIPTYNPGLRIWEYNITEFNSYDGQPETQGRQTWAEKISAYLNASVKKNTFRYGDWNDFFQKLEGQLDDEEQVEKLISELENSPDTMNNRKYLEMKAPSKDKTIPNIMPASLPLGPAYIPQALSPERYAQYYVDLNEVNYQKKDIDSWKFNYKLHYSTDDKSESRGLLVKDWVNFGRKLAKTAPVKGKEREYIGDSEAELKSEELWKNYVDRAFISSGYQELPGAVGK
ncbi:hypothetical protein PMKS-000833 [Pichia membranifaciens]|uniref:Uncharacterized protein n=1 Tax=Pichia membranifaciens TaxID=4926 RepID=A0A1Q2YCY9_9ASCO|nr:hypothetical protein PMKS-000833 [Pichia membranifaciens]